MPLRKIEEKDLELILKWRNHPLIRQNMFHQEVISLESHKAWFYRESGKDNCCWLIYSDAEGKLTGVIYCTAIDNKNSHGFWGFYAAPDARPGTGTLMCTEGLNYFFEKYELNKINAEVIEANKRSHTFHKKMGFNVEGEFLEHYKNNSGFQTVTRYALFLKDWLKR
jgi:UDP-4-amino-4,6-dideoxy-N-acetyl-beta-L-altrosamine N-acetyltransferase